MKLDTIKLEIQTEFNTPHFLWVIIFYVRILFFKRYKNHQIMIINWTIMNQVFIIRSSVPGRPALSVHPFIEHWDPVISVSTLLIVPRYRLYFKNKGIVLWQLQVRNAGTVYLIILAPSISAFKSALKTYLFSQHPLIIGSIVFLLLLCFKFDSLVLFIFFS